MIDRAWQFVNRANCCRLCLVAFVLGTAYRPILEVDGIYCWKNLRSSKLLQKWNISLLVFYNVTNNIQKSIQQPEKFPTDMIKMANTQTGSSRQQAIWVLSLMWDQQINWKQAWWQKSCTNQTKYTCNFSVIQHSAFVESINWEKNKAIVTAKRRSTCYKQNCTIFKLNFFMHHSYYLMAVHPALNVKCDSISIVRVLMLILGEVGLRCA